MKKGTEAPQRIQTWGEAGSERKKRNKQVAVMEKEEKKATWVKELSRVGAGAGAGRL